MTNMSPAALRAGAGSARLGGASVSGADSCTTRAGARRRRIQLRVLQGGTVPSRHRAGPSSRFCAAGLSSWVMLPPATQPDMANATTARLRTACSDARGVARVLVNMTIDTMARCRSTRYGVMARVGVGSVLQPDWLSAVTADANRVDDVRHPRGFVGYRFRELPLQVGIDQSV